MCPALMSTKLLDGEDATRWTKNTSVTTLQYIFMPLVQNLHWTLAVICHPGIKGGSALRASGLRPTILHFDSCGDYHDRERMRGIIAGWLEACLRAEAKREQRSRDKATAGRTGTSKEKEATRREKRKEAKRCGKIEQQATQLRNIRIHKVDAPKQKNLVDCGMCVIMNVERLLSLVPEGLDEVVRRVEKMTDEGRKTNAGKGYGEAWRRWYSQQDITRRREELNAELRKLGAGDITTNVRAASDKGEVDGSTGKIHVWAGTARYQIGRGIQEQKQDRERAEEYKKGADLGLSSGGEDGNSDSNEGPATAAARGDNASSTEPTHNAGANASAAPRLRTEGAGRQMQQQQQRGGSQDEAASGMAADDE